MSAEVLQKRLQNAFQISVSALLLKLFLFIRNLGEKLRFFKITDVFIRLETVMLLIKSFPN